MIARLKEQARITGVWLADVLDAVAATIQVDEDDMQISIRQEQPTSLSIRSLSDTTKPVS